MWTRRFRFNYQNIERIPDQVVGVYSFWCNAICIYVGKAKYQPIKKRLRQHYMGCENAELKLWLNSSHLIEFKYDVIRSIDLIDVKERKSIKELAPLTNKKLK
jgi:excinuclease UvrABC nuclease subunit